MTTLALSMTAAVVLVGTGCASSSSRNLAVATLTVQHQCDAQHPGKGFTLERFIQQYEKKPGADPQLIRQLAQDPAVAREIASQPAQTLALHQCQAFVPFDWEEQPATAQSPTYTRDLMIGGLTLQQACNNNFPGKGYSIDRLIEVMRKDAKPGEDVSVIKQIAAEPAVIAQTSRRDSVTARMASAEICQDFFEPK